VLKSLRTRAGLREDRLAGTELALDTLTGLAGVRELIAAGDTPERAIVRAVSAAAGGLEPTYSIVADVSLGLGLSAHTLPDAGLYAADLSQRRAALLKNWERLHQLRSAPGAGRAPAPRALRLEIETAALSALAVALTDAGRQLAPPAAAEPAPGPGAPLAGERAAQDRSSAVPGRGRGPGPPLWPRAPVAGEAARPGLDPPAAGLPRLARSQTPLLLAEFQRISRALRGALAREPGARGWPHDLRPGSKPPTELSTSFGIKAMLLLDGCLAPDLIPVVEQLRDSSGGGYAARAQVAPRPEATAAVIDALHRVDGTARFDDQIAAMKQDLGEFEKTRPFILTSVLEMSVQVGSDPDLTRSLVRNLLAARQSYDGLLLWPEKAEEHLVNPAPSIAHTARAVRALAQARAAWAAIRKPAGPEAPDAPDTLDAEVRVAADQAAAWLAEQQDLVNVSELIDRQVADRVEPVYIRHFTAAWVVKALVSVGLPASHPTVASAVTRIWDDYNADVALWSWSNGDLPVWMTLDALDALRLAALATPIPPGGFGVP
jgi:hypothetical protein